MFLREEEGIVHLCDSLAEGRIVPTGKCGGMRSLFWMIYNERFFQLPRPSDFFCGGLCIIPSSLRLGFYMEKVFHDLRPPGTDCLDRIFPAFCSILSSRYSADSPVQGGVASSSAGPHPGVPLNLKSRSLLVPLLLGQVLSLRPLACVLLPVYRTSRSPLDYKQIRTRICPPTALLSRRPEVRAPPEELAPPIALMPRLERKT